MNAQDQNRADRSAPADKPGDSCQSVEPGSAAAASNYTGQWLKQVRFDSAGLVCAIAQDAGSGRVLMVAWMNREALSETVATGRAVYWSRSRRKLWRKGEESGNDQRIREIRLDCDGDVVLLQVHQGGGIACHTGRQSCLFRVLRDGQWVPVDPVLKDPVQMYGPANSIKDDRAHD